MINKTQEKENIVIRFAGDSGDGIQLTGMQFTTATALAGNDLGTFPDFPAEIRAPAGTLAGVSGFQLHFGSNEIHTPGDFYDVLVVMNVAALKMNLGRLKKGGVIIANTDGFDPRNMRLANMKDGDNPLENDDLEDFQIYKIQLTKLTREALKDLSISTKEADRSKNMFVLGLLYWMYNRNPKPTIEFLERKFKNKPDIVEANVKALLAGYNYGDTTEVFTTRFEVKPAKIAPGTYRSITGNQATALGLVTAAEKSGLKLFYGTYPITPASEILHELSRHKNFGVLTFQAEDEIAAICSAIGASYGGSLGVTASSGPGIALKTEAIGLALMLEIPLVIINVQRSGPSTGMPTKTEQADLLQAVYGRNGEAPVPVIAAHTPSGCFDAIYEACRIATEFMTPIFFLSDGYLANGSEPWKIPDVETLSPFHYQLATANDKLDDKFYPYLRDERLVRKWAIPGTEGLEHRIGGLEKEDVTGNISYDPLNHEKMVKIREKKVQNIADFVPELTLDSGPKKGDVLVLSWGSPYGTIKTAIKELQLEGFTEVSHAQLTWLNPLPRNLEKIIGNFKHVLVPEINNGQLVKIIRDKYLIPAIPFNKIQGMPFTVVEIKEKILHIAGVVIRDGDK